ncbi:hypothetical protein HDZ31DRAFT_61343 [Schizophyllum fasciatum]
MSYLPPQAGVPPRPRQCGGPNNVYNGCTAVFDYLEEDLADTVRSPVHNGSQGALRVPNLLTGAATPAYILEASRSSTSGASSVVGLYKVMFDIEFSTGYKGLSKEVGKNLFMIEGTESMQNVFAQMIIVGSRTLRNQKGSPIDLHSDLVKVTFPGGLNLDPEHDSKAVQDFYNHYDKDAHKEFYFTSQARKKPHCLSFTLVILKDLYDEAVQALETAGGTQAELGQRRPASSSLLVPEGKRRKSGILRSRFISDRAHTPARQRSELSRRVVFSRLTPSIDRPSGVVTFKETSSAMEGGTLSNAPMTLPPFAKGRSKTVFNFTIDSDGREYVAKELSYAGENVNVDQNAQDLLLCDIARNIRMSDFAEQFKQAVAKTEASIEEFIVTDAFLILARPEKEETVKYSPYLVEPKRSTFVVTKFVGTLSTRRKTDALQDMITAFWHFVCEYTACSFVLADLQGSLDMVKNKRTLILFDPQSHSVLCQDGGEGKLSQSTTPNIGSYSSGLGDHGAYGIRSLIKDHDCSELCHTLDLAPKDSLLATLDHQQVCIEKAIPQLQDAIKEMEGSPADQREGLPEPTLSDFMEDCYPSKGKTYEICTE